MEGLVDSFVMGVGGVEVVLVWQLIGAFIGAKNLDPEQKSRLDLRAKLHRVGIELGSKGGRRLTQAHSCTSAPIICSEQRYRSMSMVCWKKLKSWY